MAVNIMHTIIFLIFISTILTKNEGELFEIGSNKTYKLSSGVNKFFYLSDFQEQLLDGGILVISSIPNSYQIPGYLYASFEHILYLENRDFYSQNMGINKIFINTEKLQGKNQFYFFVRAEKEVEMTIEVKIVSEVRLSLYEKIHFKLSDVSKILLPTKDIDVKKVFIYATAENIFNFNIDLSYIINYKTINFETTQKFPNGKGSIISMDQIENKEEGNFILTINANEKFQEQTLDVGFEISDEGDNMKSETEIMEHKYGATLEGENCYQIKSFDNSKSATMLINIYSQYLTFSIKKDREKLYSLDVFNNYFIKIPSLISESNNYFCLKKFSPKEEETEKLGLTSYDFQIYYDQEVLDIKKQIIPLINGQIYIHSISSGDIFMYRHHSFSNLEGAGIKNKVYSANLLAIRGKPHLYGKTCLRFPLCNVYENDFPNLNLVEPIGQHSILKVINVYGNNEEYKKDNGDDPLSEASYQYIAVVRCESDIFSPNKGECKYAIEINNELDIIQLAPEIPLATIITSPINYFHIKISDYQTIKYMKILLTSLTGNANIYLYKDRNYQNLINSYNLKHVHKKQIIEITESFIEDYYIKVTSVEYSFIELKYETDFYNKGYTMLNPNLVNIEYANKAKGFQTFEIQNPHYIYPTNNKKNNDFFFTIKALDCSMSYGYNFKEFEGIENIHHEVKRNDINFATSYGFMLKVDSYYHTVEGDNEDCAMIIYTGEKSYNTPLVIIENTPYPSNFNETYFTYPFIYNSSFSGIFVDIKFDYESLYRTNENPLIEVIFKIRGKLLQYEKKIKEDYTYYIKNDQVKDKCYFQCSLNITILKINKQNLENDKENSYTFYTNVYRGNSSSPVYIYKNNLYNYKLLPSGAKYFYTQIDLNEEGEFNCNFLEGNGMVWAKIVKKDEIEENCNWNNRIKLPESGGKNLLEYDPIYQSIKYTKEDTKKCEKGCELYIKIKSEELTYNETEFTEFSFYVNDKKNNAVTMRLNDYIKGTLEKGVNKNYRIKIPWDLRKFAINLYSSYGKAKIKYEGIFEWDIIPENQFERLVITNETIKKETLKGEEFIISITIKDDLPEGELKDHYLDYYLQIQPLYNNEKAYYHLTSERSIICNTEEDTFCHVMLYYSHYYNYENKLVYAIPMSDYKEINIYARYTYSLDALNNRMYKDTLINDFPTIERYYQSSNKKDYLLLDPSSLKNIDYYVFLTVDCGITNGLIKLILSGNYNRKTLLKNNNDKVIAWYNIIDFVLPSNDTDYILYIKNINNKYINFFSSFVSNEEYLIDNFYTEISKGKSFHFQTFSDQALVYIKIEKKYNDKIYKIYKNEINRINSTGEIFPQYIYADKKNIQKIQFSLHSFSSTKYEEKKSFDLFNIEAFIIDQKNLDSKIISSNYQIKGEKINAYFLDYEEIGIVDIPSEEMPSNKNYYIFMKIEKNAENKNKYKLVITDYIFLERKKIDDPVNIFLNRRYFSQLTNNHLYEYYSIKHQGGEYLIIDISEDIPFNGNVSFNIQIYYGSTPKYSTNYYYGRKRIVIYNYADCKDIIFYLGKTKNTEEQSKNYSIILSKARDKSDYFDDFYSFQSKFNSTIVIQTNNKTNNSILTINDIFYLYRVKYLLNIYEKKEQTDSIGKITTTYRGNKHKNEIFSYIFDGTSRENYKMVELNYTKQDLKKNYLVSIIADRAKYNEVIERYMYNSTLIDPEKDESEGEETSSSDSEGKDGEADKDNKDDDSDEVSLALIIPLCIIGMVIIVAGILFFLKRRKNIITEETIEKDFTSIPLTPISR